MDAWSSRLAIFAVLVVSTATIGATTAVTSSCCNAADGSTCCPDPSIQDLADNLVLSDENKLRVVYDPERCCSDDASTDTGCLAYGVEGCSFCRDVCDDNDNACVLCSVADSSGDGEDDVYTNAPIKVPTNAPATSPTNTPNSGATEATRTAVKWDDIDDFNEDTNGSLKDLSYDFSSDSEQYDCSNCSWDSMSTVKQRLLTQRSRSMVCDSSCLRDSGDADYGVTMCNYFNAGKECRACCHEGHMIDGCMPCEGEGSCDACISTIVDLCNSEPCQPECQAHVCCSVQWGEYSGCEETMHDKMAEIAADISDQCNTFFTCDAINPTCSDNARTCSAESSASADRRLQERMHKRCRVMEMTGAGIFDMKYTSGGVLSDELIFRSLGAKHFVLQSISIDACTDMEKISFINAESAEIIVARSSTGSLAWDDGTEPNPHVMNTGVGCTRHVWLLQDKAGGQDHVFVTVDENDHPHFISSDWVRVDLDGKMTRTDLDLSCVEKHLYDIKF